MHPKTLIADGEIAIIGSANVNHRSFTCDSETSVVVFDDNDKRDRNFARLLRMATWREFVRTQAPPSMLESWTAYATAVKQTSTEFAKITHMARTAG